MAHRSIAWALHALALPLLAACFAPVESTVSLSEPGEPYDQRLIGTWYPKEPHEHWAVVIDIEAQEETPALDITGLWMKWRATPPVYWLRATAFASRIGSEVYYNVRREPGAGLDYTADGEQPGFMVWKARFADDAAVELCALHLDKEALKNPEYRSRSVKGTFPEGDDEYLVLDASRETLIGLVRDDPFDDDGCLPLLEKRPPE